MEIIGFTEFFYFKEFILIIYEKNIKDRGMYGNFM